VSHASSLDRRKSHDWCRTPGALSHRAAVGQPVILLVGWAARTIVGTVMAVAVNLKPTYPLQIAGYVFPGYTALTTVILNVTLVIVLTPLFGALKARRTPIDETVTSDCHIRDGRGPKKGIVTVAALAAGASREETGEWTLPGLPPSLPRSSATQSGCIACLASACHSQAVEA
jgi:hypothetical protein